MRRSAATAAICSTLIRIEATHAPADGLTPIRVPGSGASRRANEGTVYNTASVRLFEPGSRAARTAFDMVTGKDSSSSAAMAGANAKR